MWRWELEESVTYTHVLTTVPVIFFTNDQHVKQDNYLTARTADVCLQFTWQLIQHYTLMHRLCYVTLGDSCFIHGPFFVFLVSIEPVQKVLNEVSRGF